MSHLEKIPLDQILIAGLQRLGLPAQPALIQQCMAYISLLSRWNKVYNLTSVRELPQMVTTHLLDSFAIAPFLSGRQIQDIGSGAGLPGLVLALLKPEWQFTLVDSNQKKTRFLTQAVIELQLKNVDIHYGRVEQMTDLTAPDWIIARAFSSLTQFMSATSHLQGANTRWMALKGFFPKDELMALPDTIKIDHIAALHVPGLAAQRHIVILSAPQPTVTTTYN